MSKMVRETAAGKVISAWVILNPKGETVAKVQAFYGNSVTVNCFHYGDSPDHASYRTDKAMGKRAALDERQRKEAFKKWHFQSGTAGGYGYDKFASSLSGMIIDGHHMTNHCSRLAAPKPPKGLAGYPSDFKCPKGYSLANWSSEKQVYGDCYRFERFKYLQAIGYNVIQAI